MGKSAIEWCTHTHNFIAGCQQVSPACDHCYAMLMSARLEVMGDQPIHCHYAGVATRDGNQAEWTGLQRVNVPLMRELLGQVRRARKPRRIFWNSMSDTFGAWVPREVLFEFLDALVQLDQHVHMLLTKRPGRMRSVIDAYCADRGIERLPWHIWCGVTVESQDYAWWRLDALVRVRAGVRYVSAEPLLGALDLGPWIGTYDCRSGPACAWRGWPWQREEVAAEASDADDGQDGAGCPGCGSVYHCGPVEGADEEREFREDKQWPIHWVIAGGESGPHARPSHPDWFRSLRDQCVAAGVAFFMKQVTERGRKVPIPADLQIREFPCP